MRIILFTGKGGVGKTTAAAGTATLAAAPGSARWCSPRTPRTRSRTRSGSPIGPEPTPVADRLFVQQVDAQRRFERSWVEIQGYLLSVLDAAGVDPITAEELTVHPGAEEVLALLEVRAQVLSGEWDVVVVDCAPTAETLRLLALPEALGWYMDRVLPAERRIVKALRPVLARAAGVPMPRDDVFDAVERLHRDLERCTPCSPGEDASVRLVLTPETVVVAEARRSLTTLSLFGYRVDGVVANRVFPDDGADEWRRTWVQAQAGVLAEVEQSFAGLPIWRSSYLASEPVGVDALAAFAEAAYDGGRPVLAAHVGQPPDHHPHPLGRDPAHRTTVCGQVRHRPRTTWRRARGDRGFLPPPDRAAGRADASGVAGARIDDGSLQVRFRADDAATEAGAVT